MKTRILQQIGVLALAPVLSATLVLSGCKSQPAGVAIRNQDGSVTNPNGSVTYPAGSQQAQQAAQPGAPVPAGSVKNADGSVTVPPNSDMGQSVAAVPAAPAQVAPVDAAPIPTPPSRATRRAEAAAAAPAERRVREVASGARVSVSISQTLSASHNNAGDSFSGVLAQPVVTANGATAFARGTRVEGTVAAAKGRGRFKGAGDLAIQLTSIGGQNVSTTEYEKVQAGKGKRTGLLAGGGAGLGAIIGGLAGGGKGALIGGLAGAGAGTAGAAYTGNKDVVIPAETVVVFRTTEAIRLR